MFFPRYRLTFIVLLVVGCKNEGPLPIIDMHLHAVPVDFEAMPCDKMCAPFKHLGVKDPKESGLEYIKDILENNTDSTCTHTLLPCKNNDETLAKTLSIMEEMNIYGVVSGTPELTEKWMAAGGKRLWRGLLLQIAPNGPTPEVIRILHAKKQLKVLGEVIIQYQGISPADSVFEPYLALAEELDIPIGIHMGPGPPGSPYLNQSKGYRGSLHNPLILESVLLKHPELRIYIMHAGWPMLDNLLTLLWVHPQVYVDVGVICYTLPKEEFYRYLKSIVDAGFIKRIMYGSDQMIWPESIAIGINAIKNAEFLTENDKRDILYNNAARFLRLTDKEMAEHYKKK